MTTAIDPLEKAARITERIISFAKSLPENSNDRERIDGWCNTTRKNLEKMAQFSGDFIPPSRYGIRSRKENLPIFNNSIETYFSEQLEKLKDSMPWSVRLEIEIAANMKTIYGMSHN